MTLKTQQERRTPRYKVERCVALNGGRPVQPGQKIGRVWVTEARVNNLTVAERTQQRVMIDYPEQQVRIVERL